MNLKTEAQLTQELSEVWRLLEAERTGFSRIIAEKDKEIERLKKDSDRYRKLRRMHCNEFQNIYVASLNGNRSFDELVDGIQTFC